MKLIFLTGCLSSGGAEWQCLLHANAMAHRGHDVRLYALYSKLDYIQRLENRSSNLFIDSFNLDQVPARLNRKLTYLRLIKQLRQELDDQTVLYAWLEIPHFLAAIACVGKPAKLIWALRNADIPKDKEPFLYKIVKLNKLFSGRVDAAIGNSDRVMNYYLNCLQYRINKKAIIFNTICNKKFFQKSLEEKAFLRKKMRIDENTCVMLSLSRVVPFKNIEQIILALKVLIDRKAFSSIRLLIVGDGEPDYVNLLQELANNAGVAKYVHWIERCEDAESYYNICDLYILASTAAEGASNSLAEAIQCGARAISTCVGEAERILPESCLIKRGTAQNIAEVALRVLKDKPSRASDIYINDSTVEMDKLEKFLLSCVDKDVSKKSTVKS